MRLAIVVCMLFAALFGAAGCRVPDEPAPYDDGHYALSLGVTVAPATITVNAGNTASVIVAVARGGGLSGSVYLRAAGVPAGVAVGFSPHPLSGAILGSTLTIAAAPAAAPDQYPLTVHASLGAYEATATLTLEIR